MVITEAYWQVPQPGRSEPPVLLQRTGQPAVINALRGYSHRLRLMTAPNLADVLAASGR
jgi:hypothetical protein